MKKDITSVDKYIEKFPSEVRILLENLRMTILEIAPGTSEGIAYMERLREFKKDFVSPSGVLGDYHLDLGNYEVSVQG